MKLKRSFACAVAGASLFASVVAAPAAMAVEGSVTVPTSKLGCDSDVDVWWNTNDPVPVGTAGNVSC